MKRLFLAMGLAALMLTACCGGQENNENKGKCEGKCDEKKEMCDHHHGPKCPEMAAEDRAEIEGIIDLMMNWDNLEDSVKVAGIAMAKARVEKCEAKRAEMDSLAPKCCKHEGEEGHKCEGKHEGCKHECEKGEEGHKCEGKHEGCKHEGMRPEGCPEAPKCEGMMTKEECDAKWAAFETLTLDEQKAVICCKLHHCPGFMMVMHEKMAPKCDSLAPKCEGNHEGCQHQCK